MTANNCPRCYTAYDHCSCGPHSATKAPPGTITPSVIRRATGKAAISMMLAGVGHVEFPDVKPEGRDMTTGRLDLRPYVESDQKEYQAMKWRERKARR